MEVSITYEELKRKIEDLQYALDEANDTIEAIRTGQVDALIMHGDNGHEVYSLKSADHTYRVFIENMTEGALTLNKEGIILYSNSQFAYMMNIPLSQVIGFSFSDFVDKTSSTQYTELLQKGWTDDSKGIVELNNAARSTVQLSITTLDVDEGNFLSMILTDLTSQKETERQLKLKNEELEQSNMALGLSNDDLQQFASVASHDLQEPLRKIQVFSNLLKQEAEEKGNTSSKKYLDKIVASSNRMKQLIINVLNYSRLSANKNNFDKVDLAEVVSDLLADYEILIQEKKAVILIGDLPIIDCNRGQIRQVFQNIISNALKFCKPYDPPVIALTVTRIKSKDTTDIAECADGGYYRFSIKDNGIGFDEKYVANVFSLFERLNTKDEYEGTGIGLAIAKKIIDKHDGLITAKSKEYEGAEFIIVLPVSQAI